MRIIKTGAAPLMSVAAKRASALTEDRGQAGCHLLASLISRHISWPAALRRVSERNRYAAQWPRDQSDSDKTGTIRQRWIGFISALDKTAKLRR